jgi:hypothetical protein
MEIYEENDRRADLVAAFLAPARAMRAPTAHNHPYDSRRRPSASPRTRRRRRHAAPGEYKFQCRTFGDRTFLVVTKADTGKEVVRVPCVLEQLNGVVSESDFRTIAREDGKHTLVSVRIKGESVAHSVVVN